MSSLKAVGAHAVTVLVTFALVLLWVDDRERGRRGSPLAQIPRVQARPNPTAPAPAPAPAPIPAEVLKAFDADEQINIRVYANANRGVVNITTASSTVGLFGDEATSSGSGSGFVIDRQGHILTNYHVVEGADSVQVTLADGSTREARVVGADASNDVAVIRVDLPAAQLSPLALGDSSGLLVGQKVLALGNPFGLERTLTTGIISSLDRSIKAKNGRTIKGIIQTDAAVNPGNSGGPLFNMNGEVIGINSQIYSRTGGFMGMSFAIPIDIAMNVKDQLMRTGTVRRSRIGVEVQDVNQSLAESFGLGRPHGALISGVDPKGPGKTAGLRPGDVITSVNGRQIQRSLDLPTIIAALTPGSVAHLGIWRDHKGIEVDVRTVLLQDHSTELARSGATDGAGKLGIAVRELNPDERQQMHTQGHLVIEAVSGPALTAGLQAGDVVLGVNGRHVDTIAQLRHEVDRSGHSVALLIQRDNAQIYVPIDLG